MKKVTHTQAQTRRRERALERFRINPAQEKDPAYMARKHTELQALHQRLGLPAPF
jgi:hypothetical protein